MKNLYIVLLALFSIALCQSNEQNDIIFENGWLTYYNSSYQRKYDNAYERLNYSYYEAFNITCVDDERNCQIYAQYKGNFKFTGFDLYTPKMINITLILNSKKEFQIKISDYDKKLFEYPEKPEYPFPYDKIKYKESDISKSEYKINIYQNPFYLKVFRQSTNELVFDTSLDQLFLSDKYVTLTTQIPTQDVFGLGERFDGFKVKTGTYHIYTEDNPASPGVTSDATYGAHPVYLLREQSHKYHIVFLRNMADMLVTVNTTQNIKYLKYEIIGSILDFKFFFGETPEDVTQLYHEYLGGYTIFPFWSLGYQHCRWGYDDISEVQDVFKGYKEHHIPVDVFWLDIDYLDQYQIFTLNKDKFSPKEIYKLKYDTMGYELKGVAIVDPSIAAQATNKNFDETSTNLNFNQAFWDGLALGVFFNQTQIYNYWPFLGKQWAGPVYYPDFVHPDSALYWEKCFVAFFEKYMNFNGKKLLDGVWLDMNEIGHFVWGRYNMSAEIDGKKYVEEESSECLNEKKIYPFIPTNECPSKKTISSDIIHYDGTKEIFYHSAYNLFECQKTNEVMKKETVFNTPLPFILTRSNTFGTQRYATHWLGDDEATYIQMKLSIGGIQRSNFYGIPLVGSDICGFIGNTESELCGRWFQLGALYPFSRNHNVILCEVDGQLIKCPSNDPWRLGIQYTAKVNMDLRYQILSYYYSLYLQNNINGMKEEYFKGTVFKPSFFNYPNDEELYKDENVDDTFMIGKELLAFPFLEKGQTKKKIYFPKNVDFFDFHTGEKVMTKYATQRTIEIENFYTGSLVPLYQVGGTIVPKQKTIYTKGYNTELFNKNDNEEYQLQITFEKVDSNKKSSGILLPVRDASDTETIYKFCVKKNNCLQTIEILNTATIMEINIKAKSKSTMKLMLGQDDDTKYFFHHIGQFDFFSGRIETGLDGNLFDMTVTYDETTTEQLTLSCSQSSILSYAQSCIPIVKVGSQTKKSIYLGFYNINIKINKKAQQKFLSQ